MSSWVIEYHPESDPVRYNTSISEEGRMECARRRRIEDIKEAARLEREAILDPWELE